MLLVDSLWHSAILDTDFYEELQGALGFRIRHRPEGVNESNNETRLVAMRALYTAFFTGEPNETAARSRRSDSSFEIPDDEFRITIRGLQRPKTSMAVNARMSVRTLKSFIEDIEGVHVVDQRILFQGRQLEDSVSLGAYGIQSESTVYMSLRLRGC